VRFDETSLFWAKKKKMFVYFLLRIVSHAAARIVTDSLIVKWHNNSNHAWQPY
jgi:hypothetical protein